MANIESHPVDRVMIDSAAQIQAQLQRELGHENFFIREVLKQQWPMNMGLSMPIFITSDSKTFVAQEDAQGVPTIVGEAKLQTAAINSPEICLDDLRKDEHVNGVLKQVYQTFRTSLAWLWGQGLQNDLLRIMKNRSVQLSVGEAKEGETLAIVQFPRAISFTGKVINPFVSKPSKNGGFLQCVNPKWSRAAKQQIFFHPLTAKFLFPNMDQWIGKIMWLNIRDRERNPSGSIGYYRAIMRYAPIPMDANLGRVVTVPPKGFIGFLWYLCWKLVKFVP